MKPKNPHCIEILITFKLCFVLNVLFVVKIPEWKIHFVVEPTFDKHSFIHSLV